MTISISELTNHSYIDHELSTTLDSTDAFEGPEKLLEIWFYPTVKSIPTKKTLRSVGREEWIEMLKLVKCEVLSVKECEKMHAYLLSESSMFVYDHKLTLKTCGTTMTLNCLDKMFEIIANELGWNFSTDSGHVYEPYKVFYSRRCFMFPQRQKSIHKNWQSEIEYLNKFFANGRSYLVGRNDEPNHWNLYVTETKDCHEEDVLERDNDETLEILMTELDIGDKFQQQCGQQLDKGHIEGYKMTRDTGISDIYQSLGPRLQHDAFAFTPCGYSSNIIVDGTYYYTLHVTPEKGWSYASFESNVPIKSLSGSEESNVDVVKRVLGIFRPREFCLTFFQRENRGDDDEEVAVMDNSLNTVKMIQAQGYKKLDRIVYDLEDYQLLYLRFRQEEE